MERNNPASQQVLSQRQQDYKSGDGEDIFVVHRPRRQPKKKLKEKIPPDPYSLNGSNLSTLKIKKITLDFLI